jgi:ATP-dependent DNA helicase RecG
VARPKTSPRKLMELAIEMMRRSVHEPRTDGKVNPIVGTVLRKSDGTVETACRGELRNGDHAEYVAGTKKPSPQS